MSEFEGDLSLVVGGASGIGRAIAVAFQQGGAEVVISDRQTCDLPGTSNVPLDVTSADHFQELEIAIRSRSFARLHVVYAAGCGSGKFGFPFWNIYPSDWPRVLDVNLIGAVRTLTTLRSILCDHPNSTVCLITSIAGQIGSQTDPPYSAAKAALINFGQCAAKDFAPFSVRVNLIAPGMVKTPLNQAVWKAWNDAQSPEMKRSYEEWAGEKVRRVTPMGRWQEPEDIAAAAIFLASLSANNITGQTLNVDGGHVMHS